MKNMYVKEGFKFIELGEKVIEQLKEIKAEVWSISKENANKVKELLNMSSYSNDELRSLRNTIVNIFSSDDASLDDFRRLGIITFMIDKEEIARGMDI